VLEEALSRLADRAPVPVVGAGRTDAGVHALGQVASFVLSREMSGEQLERALNGLLPPDIRVREAAETGPGFDARRDAIGKLYRYELDLGPVRLPTRRRLAGYHRGALDPRRVEEVAALYVGRHDFAALASSGSDVATTVRTVTRSAVRVDEQTLVYEVEAEGFLRKMVRSMVGGLIAAGSGSVSVKALREALRGGDRQAWPPPAEACGLTLVRVDYPVQSKT
jgi:tRNA pseudouridine38-40 synthase